MDLLDGKVCIITGAGRGIDAMAIERIREANLVDLLEPKSYRA